MSGIGISCRDLVELVTDYLEQVLVEEAAEAVETHLRECAACRRYVEQMRLTVRALRHLAHRPAA